MCCLILRSPVCGSDGKVYGNDCEMKLESCRQQRSITSKPMTSCSGKIIQPMISYS